MTAADSRWGRMRPLTASYGSTRSESRTARRCNCCWWAWEPAADECRTSDPASWTGWLRCVADVGRTAVPRFPQT